MTRYNPTRLIGWLLVATGSGHATLVAVGYATTPPADERAVRALMAATAIPVAGLERSYWDLFQGFSLMMALMLVGLGALVLLVEPTRSVKVLLAVVLVPALAISVLLLPPPPIVLIGLAAVAATVGLLRGGPRQVERAGRERHQQLTVDRDQADAGTTIQ